MEVGLPAQLKSASPHSGPGVPSECRALKSDWMSFSRSTRSLQDGLAIPQLPGDAALGGGIESQQSHGTRRAKRPVVETRTSNVAGRVVATNVADPYSASTSGPSRRRRAIK